MLSLLHRSGYYRPLKSVIKSLPVVKHTDATLRMTSSAVELDEHEPIFTYSQYKSLKAPKKVSQKGVPARPKLDEAEVEEIRRDINKFLPIEQQHFIGNLYATIKAQGGIAHGISTIQVGVPQRAFISTDRIYTQRHVVDVGKGKKVSGDLVVAVDLEFCINPKVIDKSSKLDRDVEGCLSNVGYYGIVARPVEIEVEYTNMLGERVRRTMTGDNARGFLHEMDHLDGILYTDHIKDKTEYFTEDQMLDYTTNFGRLLPKWK